MTLQKPKSKIKISKPRKKKTRSKTTLGPKAKLHVTAEMVNEIGILSARGMMQKDISDYYGISSAAWYEYTATYPEIVDAYKKGKAKGFSLAAGKLMEWIKKGDKEMIKFYLKNKGMFADNVPLEPGEETTKPSISALSITTDDPIEASRIYQQIMGEKR